MFLIFNTFNCINFKIKTFQKIKAISSYLYSMVPLPIILIKLITGPTKFTFCIYGMKLIIFNSETTKL